MRNSHPQCPSVEAARAAAGDWGCRAHFSLDTELLSHVREAKNTHPRSAASDSCRNSAGMCYTSARTLALKN